VIQLRFTEAAARSIVEQTDFYLQQAGAELALHWEASVEEAVQSLLQSPERGSHCRFSPLALQQVRWIPVAGFPKHSVFYRYEAEQSIVRIVQVVHGARDLEAVFGNSEDK
jgi:plasmid stabilization system protein ParE